mmetsp:Transcript_24049/g.50998  ORF Transcript_24049/g.50998 Transcript_24049/m.50998 type:complete len:505 (+) Transcript_24049:1030-2544(+)
MDLFQRQKRRKDDEHPRLRGRGGGGIDAQTRPGRTDRHGLPRGTNRGAEPVGLRVGERGRVLRSFLGIVVANGPSRRRRTERFPPRRIVERDAGDCGDGGRFHGQVQVRIGDGDRRDSSVLAFHRVDSRGQYPGRGGRRCRRGRRECLPRGDGGGPGRSVSRRAATDGKPPVVGRKRHRRVILRYRLSSRPRPFQKRRGDPSGFHRLLRRDGDGHCRHPPGGRGDVGVGVLDRVGRVDAAGETRDVVADGVGGGRCRGRAAFHGRGDRSGTGEVRSFGGMFERGGHRGVYDIGRDDHGLSFRCLRRWRGRQGGPPETLVVGGGVGFRLLRHLFGRDARHGRANRKWKRRRRRRRGNGAPQSRISPPPPIPTVLPPKFRPRRRRALLPDIAGHALLRRETGRARRGLRLRQDLRPPLRKVASRRGVGHGPGGTRGLVDEPAPPRVVAQAGPRRTAAEFERSSRQRGRARSRDFGVELCCGWGGWRRIIGCGMAMHGWYHWEGIFF